MIRSAFERTTGCAASASASAGAAVAGALVVAVDGLAVAVLHPVDQRRLDPQPAVGEHRVGRDHVVERRLAGAERIGEQLRHVVVDAEALGVLADDVHADVLGDAHRHQVARLLEPGADRRRAVELLVGVLRPPDAGAGRHLDRRVDHDGRRAVAVVERRGVDEGLERRARLAQRLGGAVEDARLVGEAALHGEHAPGLGVHRHEAALDRRDLAVGPARRRRPRRRSRLDQDRRRRRPRCRPGPRAARSRPLLVAQPRPARVLEGAGNARPRPPARPRCRCAPRSRRSRASPPGASRRCRAAPAAAASARAPARLVGGVEARRLDLRRPARGRPASPRSYCSSPSRSARAATSCRSGSTVARMVRPPVNSSSSPRLAESWRRISSVK